MSYPKTQSLNDCMREAIKKGSMSDVQYIVEVEKIIINNSLVHHIDSFLWIAIHWGKVDIAKYLIDQGADLYWGREDSALIDACYLGYVSLAEHLVRVKKMSIHDHRESALMMAIINKQYLMVKWLVENGANTRIDDYKAHTLAKNYGNEDIVKFFGGLKDGIYKT